jgi:hypothetical protein
VSDPARFGRSWRSPRSMVWLALGLGVFSGALRFYLFRFDLPPA